MSEGYRKAVGIMIINDEGMVYAFQRSDFPENWQCPEGGLEGEEDPRSAALRELYEETGITEDAVEFLSATEDFIPYDTPGDIQARHGNRGQQKKFYLVRLTRVPNEFNLRVEDKPEFIAVKLLTAKQLVDSVTYFKRDLYSQVIQYFQAYLA